jgi:hypothetical protein
MTAKLIADLLVLLHLGFILFVVLGGVLVLKWRWLAWLHIPCVIWGVLIELHGWICPLTPLELHFRQLAGEVGYHGGFIDHYLVPLIYPPGLTSDLQIALAVILLIINLALYGYVLLGRFWRQQDD